MAGWLATPLVLPLVAVARLSDDAFRTVGEAVALLPYAIGIIVREQFYRRTLRRCGRNVLIESGALFVYRDVSVGDNVLIGRYSIVHHCDIGSYVLIGEGCTLLSGAEQHFFDRPDVPIALQGGRKRRIAVGDDCWIGSRGIVMDDVGRGSVVGAGAVVTRTVPPWSVALGNPAKWRPRRSGPPTRRDEAAKAAGPVGCCRTRAHEQLGLPAGAGGDTDATHTERPQDAPLACRCADAQDQEASAPTRGNRCPPMSADGASSLVGPTPDE
ncbi:MAG: acyltransferase [Acidimicrobiales bacterium]